MRRLLDFFFLKRMCFHGGFLHTASAVKLKCLYYSRLAHLIFDHSQLFNTLSSMISTHFYCFLPFSLSKAFFPRAFLSIDGERMRKHQDIWYFSYVYFILQCQPPCALFSWFYVILMKWNYFAFNHPSCVGTMQRTKKEYDGFYCSLTDSLQITASFFSF